jgi:thiol-disulfide isomerase/thioredoxin
MPHGYPGVKLMRTLLPLLVASIVASSCFAGAATRLPALKATRWVNSPLLTPEGLRGKVVLVDVWEYTCINWIRTLPYIKAWNRQYADLGLVVVGVHSPEFQFGHRAENVDRGIRDHELNHPIAIDNDFAIWRALGNNAWPTKYLFDHRGQLINTWIGEGRYDEIESEVRRALAVADPAVRLPPVSQEATEFAKSGQPSYFGITGETYLGAERRERGAVTLEGDWRRERQYIELRQGTGTIVLPFTGGEVNLVIQPGPSGHGAVTVWLDGTPIGEFRGADVGADGVARFDAPRMIRVVAGAPRGRHVLTLVTSDPGVRAFAFTFGP